MLILVLGGYTLAVITTIVAAIIARALTRGALFSVLSLPLLLPLLIFLIQGTAGAADGYRGDGDQHSSGRALDGRHHDHRFGHAFSGRLVRLMQYSRAIRLFVTEIGYARADYT